jgi:predicted DNA-binding transcriptional regulator AlpA
MSPVPDKLMLKTSEIAAMLGVPPRTITRWWQQGVHGFPAPDLPGNGDRWHRWHRNTIQRWVDRRGGKAA